MVTQAQLQEALQAQREAMQAENALQIQNPGNLKFIFDLKGSTVNRKVKGKIKSTTTLKD